MMMLSKEKLTRAHTPQARETLPRGSKARSKKSPNDPQRYLHVPFFLSCGYDVPQLRTLCAIYNR